MATFPTKFGSVLDLAKLPWFEIRDGSRLIADPAVGPVIDVHSHFATVFLRRYDVDLHAETPRADYYLPMTSPLDLEPYSNVNFDKAALRHLQLDLSLHSVFGGGMRTSHTAPNLLRDMRDLGIVASVVLPFDLPIGASMAEQTLEACARYPELWSFGSVHPQQRGIDDRLARQKAAGARGIKLHPNAQFIAPDHPKTVHLCGRCGAHGLPILIHCGPAGIEPKAAQERSRVFRYEQMIAEHPETNVILGHCGAREVELGVQYAKYPNAWFDISCLGLGGIRTVLEKVPHDRILYGTDWPFYHQAITLARVLMLTEGDEQLRRAILHDNAQRLLGTRRT